MGSWLYSEHIFACAPEGILLRFICLDLLSFVGSSCSCRLAHLWGWLSFRVLQVCVFTGMALWNIKGWCCCTQLLLLLLVCQLQDDFFGLLFSLQPPAGFAYLYCMEYGKEQLSHMLVHMGLLFCLTLCTDSQGGVLCMFLFPAFV